jgi:hypothetical protein
MPNASIYESPFPEYSTEVHYWRVICPTASFYSDLIEDGYAKVESTNDGRLAISPLIKDNPLTSMYRLGSDTRISGT